MTKLDEEWVKINKNKSKTDNTTKCNQEKYTNKIEGLFNIASKDIEEVIGKDRLRSHGSKEEDIKFWIDQKDPKKRKMVIGTNDVVYEAKVAKKIERVELKADKEKRVKDSEINSPGPEAAVGAADISIEESIPEEPDKDFNANMERSKKPATVTLEVPRRILEHTAMTNARCGVSARSHTMTLAQTIVSSGGNVEDFVLSAASANRFRNSAGSKKADEVKESFRNKMIEIGRKFVVHFDGKLVKDVTGSKRSERERLAVLLSSPELAHPQLLGIPPIPRGTGEEIMEGILEVIMLLF